MKKIITIISLIFLILFEIEIALQLVGWGLLKYSVYKNNISTKEQELKILIVGDCISSDSMYFGDRPWPRILEQKIKERGIKVKVYNESYPQATTSAIANRLPDYVAKYKPDVIISMSSFVDSNIVWLQNVGIKDTKESSFFDRLKLVKIAKGIAHFRDFYNGRKSTLTPQSEYVDESDLKYPNFKILLKKIKMNNSLWKDEVVVFLKDKTALQKAQFYSLLAFEQIPSDIGTKKDVDNALELFRLALSNSFYVKHAATSFLWQATLRSDRTSCLWLFNLYQNSNYNITDEEVNALALCLPPKSNLQVKKYFEKNKIFLDEKDHYEINITKTAYNNIYQQAAHHNICLVATQYPLLDVKNLKDLFSKNIQNEIYFASNRENFEALLKIHKPEKVFTDFIGGVWGHGRDLANETIATSVLNTLDVLLKNKQCKYE